MELQKEKKQIKKGKNESLFNTETMLKISEVRWDTMILKDGWLRAIIRVYWLNLDLRNYEEQKVVLEQYKRFLNWLDFPIQILVRSTYLDLTDYIDYMKSKVAGIDNEVLKWQWEQYVSFIDDINSKQWLIFTKEFYIVIPYYTGDEDGRKVRKPWWQKFLDSLDSKDTPEKIVARYRKFVSDRKFLDTRCNLIVEWLRAFSVIAERMDVADIVSLLFKVYNPNSHKLQSDYKE